MTSQPHRKLGTGGLSVSTIGLGCMSLSGVYGAADDVASEALIHHAIDEGVDHLDSSDMYGWGHIEQLLGRLSETEACGFEDLFADGDGSRQFMIVTFLALLEMIRLKLIRAFQSGSFGAIRVYKRARPADAPHPIGDPENHP